MEQVKESIVQEQLLNSLAPQIRVWVKECRPKSSLETGQLADDYVEERKQTKEESLFYQIRHLDPELQKYRREP